MRTNGPTDFEHHMDDDAENGCNDGHVQNPFLNTRQGNDFGQQVGHVPCFVNPTLGCAGGNPTPIQAVNPWSWGMNQWTFMLGSQVKPKFNGKEIGWLDFARDWENFLNTLTASNPGATFHDNILLNMLGECFGSNFQERAPDE